MSKIITKFCISLALIFCTFNNFSALPPARGEIMKKETTDYVQYTQRVTTPIKEFLITCTRNTQKSGTDAGKIDCYYIDVHSGKKYSMASTEFNDIEKDYKFQQGVLQYGSVYPT